MAVRIRLRRIGKKKQPEYRLVAAEGSGPRDGRFLEAIGHYNPRVDPPAVRVNEERALWWLKQGAQPTDTAKSMLVKTGVWEKFTGEPAPAAPTPAAEPEAEAAIEPPGMEVATEEGEAAAEPSGDEIATKQAEAAVEPSGDEIATKEAEAALEPSGDEVVTNDEGATVSLGKEGEEEQEQVRASLEGTEEEKQQEASAEDSERER